MKRLLSILKCWWSESSSTHRLAVIAALSGWTILASMFLVMTIDYWAAPTIIFLFLVLYAWDWLRNFRQQQYAEQQKLWENSQKTAAEFVQWLFSKQQRDRLGIQAVPLSASLAYLTRHAQSEQTAQGLVHTLSIGLQEFNTQRFYLLWESLAEPIDEALAEYCKIKGLVDVSGEPFLQMVSADILDGAIQPQIILKLADTKFYCRTNSNPILSNEDYL